MRGLVSGSRPVVLGATSLVFAAGVYLVSTHLKVNFFEIQDYATRGGAAVSRPSFTAAMRAFPWQECEKAAATNDLTESIKYGQLLLDELFPFLLMEPVAPVNRQCKPPPLIDPEDIDCSSYPTGLTGVKRQKPAKVAHLIMLGFDVDVLEVHMNELYDVVDHFVIAEATQAHQKNLHKPLTWEQLQRDRRFKHFRDKVVHIIIDDSKFADEGKSFQLEHIMEKIQWESFLDWNQKMGGLFQDDDILGIGHADEIPSRDNVQLVKHCELKSPSVDIGMWFPFGVLDQAFESDSPVAGHPYTLGDPTFWTLASAKSYNHIPSRRAGQSGPFLLGGLHMSDHGYLPYMMTKMIVCSECDRHFLQRVPMFAKRLKNPTPSSIKELEVAISRAKEFGSRIRPISELDKELDGIAYIPWFMKCNMRRYPTWQRGGHDPRLDY